MGNNEVIEKDNDDLLKRVAFVQKTLGVLGEAYRNDWSDVDGRVIRDELATIAGFLDENKELPSFEEWLDREWIYEGDHGYHWKGY